MYDYNVTVDVRVRVTVPVAAVHLESACETAEMRVTDAICKAMWYIKEDGTQPEVNVVGVNPERVARAYRTGALEP